MATAIPWSLALLAATVALVGVGLAVGAGALLAGLEVSAAGVSVTLSPTRIAVGLSALAGGLTLGAVGVVLSLP